MEDSKSNIPKSILLKTSQYDDENLNRVIHQVPVAFQSYCGPAKVSSFFIPRNVDSEDSDLKCVRGTFRGKELRGTVLDLKGRGVTGFVFKDDEDDVNEEDDKSTRRIWKVDQKFDSFYNWNRETNPKNNDPIYKCLRWISLSNDIHRKVNAEEMEKEKIALEKLKSSEKTGDDNSTNSEDSKSEVSQKTEVEKEIESKDLKSTEIEKEPENLKPTESEIVDDQTSPSKNKRKRLSSSSIENKSPKQDSTPSPSSKSKKKK